jgi:FeS assembly protein IscX
MSLKWENYSEIAEKLEEKFSDADLLNISNEEIDEMVNSLEDFSDAKSSDNEDIYLAIITVWTEIRYKDEKYDDSIYDAYV